MAYIKPSLTAGAVDSAFDWSQSIEARTGISCGEGTAVGVGVGVGFAVALDFAVSLGASVADGDEARGEAD